MALSVTARGTGTHNTSATSFTLSPGSNCTAGATVVLCVAADNSSSQGATNDFTTVTDTLGNTWTKRQSPVFDNGAASAGVQGAIYTTSQNAGTLTTGTTITVSFGSSPTAKTWTLTEVNAASGFTANFRTGGDKAAGATGTALTTGASASVNVGEVILAAFFLEAGTTQSITAEDTDGTNGSWATSSYAEIGSTTSGSVIASSTKLQTTANSTQSYDITVSVSSDYHASYIILQEVQIVSSGTLSSTLAAVTDSATGTVAVSGTTSATLAAVTDSATGTVAVSGSTSATLDAATLSATGTVGTSEITGTLAVTLGAVTDTATGAVDVTGSTSATLGTLTDTATGTVAVTGSTSATLGTLTDSAAGTVAVTGSTSATLGTLTDSATGVVGNPPVTGLLDSTLAAVTDSATGTVVVSGTTSATLGTLTESSTGTVPVQGSSTSTLGGVVETAAGVVDDTGVVVVTLDAASGSSTGVVGIMGAASTTLNTLVLDATGVSGNVAPIVGVLNVILNGVMQARPPGLSGITHIKDGCVAGLTTPAPEGRVTTGNPRARLER